MTCPGCRSSRCAPKFFRLCPECQGLECEVCQYSLVPGVMECEEFGDWPVIRICSEWQDPEVDAAIFDSRRSLINAIVDARDAMMGRSPPEPQ